MRGLRLMFPCLFFVCVLCRRNTLILNTFNTTLKYSTCPLSSVYPGSSTCVSSPAKLKLPLQLKGASGFVQVTRVFISTSCWACLLVLSPPVDNAACRKRDPLAVNSLNQTLQSYECPTTSSTGINCRTYGLLWFGNRVMWGHWHYGSKWRRANVVLKTTATMETTKQ